MKLDLIWQDWTFSQQTRWLVLAGKACVPNNINVALFCSRVSVSRDRETVSQQAQY